LHSAQPTENETLPEVANRIEAGPVVVEVRDVGKTFRIPEHRVDSVKERVVHPFRSNHYREMEALRDVSFDVHEGEFFGIVGLNGSGKSTLLKILGGIYRADAGRIRIAGRVAPFIELGVGFNPELNASENIVLSAVMLGLSRQEARARVDAVVEFAGLEDFVELKLKNYSSGMMVRLAFSVMVQAEADIMLIDEVLAVGDASFQQKCGDVFHDMREAGKTIILVTHDMASIEKFCHRAMMIHDGEVSLVGTPEEVSEWYMRANFRKEDERPGFHAGGSEEGDDAHVVEAWVEDEGGHRVENAEQGSPFRIAVVVEALREIPAPVVSFVITDEAGVHIFGFDKRLSGEAGLSEGLEPGQRVQVVAEVRNLLRPGRYFLHGRAYRNDDMTDVSMQVMRFLDFVVFGTDTSPGAVSLVEGVEVSEPRADS
jgi:ABC-type polysaccharide/polyol phosphate transport system ATPase subunit